MASAPITPDLHAALLRLIAKVATDVWNETPLFDHLEAAVAEGGDRTELLALVADSLSFSEHNDGSYTPEQFLDMTQYFWGMDNEMFAPKLRQLAQSTDPGADERAYGSAQRRAKQRAGVQ